MNRKIETTMALKEYFRHPIFKYKPCKEPVSFVLNKEKWTIGVQNQLDEDKACCTTLTMEHGMVLLGIFCFTNPFAPSKEISFSFHEFCELLYGCSNQKTYKKARLLLEDLRNCWTKIEHEDGKITLFPILQKIKIGGKKKRKSNANDDEFERWLECVELDEEYYKLIYNIERRMCLELSYVKQLTSNLARTILMYLPSRAIKSTAEEKTFKITLTKLLEQIGYSPISIYKSKRKQLFTKNGDTSIINQLNGAKLLNDKIFRCELEETVNKKDINLLCWIENKRSKIKEPKGDLYKTWKNSGGSLVIWHERLSQKKFIDFNSYEIDALNYIANWERSRTFLIMAKCLLGDLFAEYIGAVKNDVLEGKSFYKSSGHAMTAELLKAIKNVKK
jgi:hypothetical protein